MTAIETETEAETETDTDRQTETEVETYRQTDRQRQTDTSMNLETNIDIDVAAGRLRTSLPRHAVRVPRKVRAQRILFVQPCMLLRLHYCLLTHWRQLAHSDLSKTSTHWGRALERRNSQHRTCTTTTTTKTATETSTTKDRK